MHRKPNISFTRLGIAGAIAVVVLVSGFTISITGITQANAQSSTEPYIRYCYTGIWNGIPNQISCGYPEPILQTCLDEKAREATNEPPMIATSECEAWVVDPNTGAPIMTLAEYNQGGGGTTRFR